MDLSKLLFMRWSIFSILARSRNETYELLLPHIQRTLRDQRPGRADAPVKPLEKTSKTFQSDYLVSRSHVNFLSCEGKCITQICVL